PLYRRSRICHLDPATAARSHPLSRHDALPVWSEEWGYREKLENSQIFTAESAGRKVRAFLFSGAEGAPGGGAVLAAGKAGQESSAEERRGGDAGRGSGRQDDGQQGEPRNDGRT